MSKLLKPKVSAPVVEEVTPEEPATLPDEQDVATVRARRKPGKKRAGLASTRRVDTGQSGREYTRGTLG